MVFYLVATAVPSQRGYQRTKTIMIKLPPWWKIRRELIRPLRQLSQLPENVFTLLFGSIYFDKFKKFQEYRGLSRSSAKVAVFVIFPANKVVYSTHYRSIRFLRENGYDVILVSNAELDKVSIDAVLPLVSKLIVRQNFGYDFGGYRQGVLDLLASDRIRVSRLLLVNDSCWFPTHYNSNFLAQAERENKDLVGLTSNFGIHRKWGTRSETDWSYSVSHKNFHYCSFFLLLSERVLYSSTFRAFWKFFPLSNRKSRVVRRGEIALTQLIIEEGFAHGEVVKVANLSVEIHALKEQQLNDVFRHLIIMDDIELQEEYRSLASSRSVNRQSKEFFILKSVARQGIPYGLLYYLCAIKEIPFLKKSPAKSSIGGLRNTLRTVEFFESEIGNEIKNELTLFRKK